MQGMILAAGMGRRLGKYTADGTKCMVKINGKSLIERTIESLLAANIRRIVIVVGYKASGLTAFVNKKFPDLDIEYVTNPVYETTNNIYSLWLAREYLKEDDTILLESDVIFDERIISELVASPESNLAIVSKFEQWMDGTVTLLDSDETIVSVIDKKHFRWDDIDKYYKTVNIYKFARNFSIKYYMPFLEAYLTAFGTNQYYEQVLSILTFLENTGLKGLPVSGRWWYEIDDPNDLHIAETLFGAKGERLELMRNSYGGYWRFPGLLDYCYLVNPYFPTDQMWEELKSGFRDVVSQYPSGMSVQSLLAAKIFNIGSETVAVGNGASELIVSLFRCTKGKVGIVDPCFNEYPARAGEERIVRYDSSKTDFAYSAKSLLAHWAGRVDWAVLVNPDNPSGHFLRHNEVFSFIDECEKAAIRPIIDESFVDFADANERFTLFDEIYLNEHPGLVLVKSISKSYGVPGLRLGVVASADVSLISQIKLDVAIWNINSLAEYFFQIFDKYAKDYKHACDRIAAERVRLTKELERLPGLHVYPSQANYLLCRLDQCIKSGELSEWLFDKESILIKDLNGKMGFESGQYIRIAIRTREDNDRLLTAMAFLQH
jgi:histidinol-phosphate/aromatic aminotransferase/cobyric acid decarboxylase-like protein/choline kinase